MRTLNIEVFDKRVVRLSETKGGDVEIVVSTLDKVTYVDMHEWRKGGVFDTVIATIPRDRRQLVANFLSL